MFTNRFFRMPWLWSDWMICFWKLLKLLMVRYILFILRTKTELIFTVFIQVMEKLEGYEI